MVILNIPLNLIITVHQNNEIIFFNTLGEGQSLLFRCVLLSFQVQFLLSFQVHYNEVSEHSGHLGHCKSMIEIIYFGCVAADYLFIYFIQSALSQLVKFVHNEVDIIEKPVGKK